MLTQKVAGFVIFGLSLFMCRAGRARRLTIIVSLALCLFCSHAFAVNGDMGGGDGSEETPWRIQDMLDFQEFAGDPDYWDDHTRLECDLNLAGIPYTTAVIAPDTDSADGFDGTSFTGIFDGDGHIISNLTIDTNGADNDYLGLFGQIEDPNAEVKNLDMVNVHITGTNDLSIILGGLCGANSGNITNCYAVGSVSGGSGSGGLCGANFGGNITNCYADGSVFGGADSYALGGLCGYSRGDISNCYATGSVTGGDDADYLGGLCGHNKYRNITNCYATGSVTGGADSSALGGLCGYNDENEAMITNCYATGSVTGGAGSDGLGGLCGNNNQGSFNDCYFLDTAGPDNGLGTPLTDSQMKQQSSFIGWDFDPDDGDPADWFMTINEYPKLYYQPKIAYSGDTDIQICKGHTISPIVLDIYSLIDETLHWSITGHESCPWITSLDPDSGVSTGPADRTQVAIHTSMESLDWGDYAHILTLTADNGDRVIILIQLKVMLNGSGSQADPFLIESFEGFLEFANPEKAYLYWAKGVYSRLECDLNLAPALPGRKIYDTAVIAPDVDPGQPGFQGTPFTGVLDGNGHIISNLTTMDGGGEYPGYLGLFGRMEGLAVDVEDPDAEVKNLGLVNVHIIGGYYSRYLGGLCGHNYYGSITNCYSSGSVAGGDYSLGIGGLCGMNQGNISNCYATGSVAGGYYSRCLGGLCGENYGNVSNCYATCLVTGGYYSQHLGGLCGKNYRSDYYYQVAGSIVAGNDYGDSGALYGWNYGGSISNCYTIGSIASGDYSQYLGGLCGENENSIANCYATGSVAGGYYSRYLGGLCGVNSGGISNCYSVGTVTSGSNSSDLGGLCGHNYYEGIISSYFLDTAGPDNECGTPLTDSQMKQKANFVDWDFVDIWGIRQGTSYPRFIWQMIPGDFLCPDGVDLLDFNILAGQWHCEGAHLAADIYPAGGDRIVDIYDLYLLCQNWLKVTDGVYPPPPTVGWRQPSLVIPGEADIVVTPYVTPDKLTMFYSRYNDSKGCREIIEANRTDPRGSFTTFRDYPELDGTVAPWLSTDRLRMYYNEVVDDVAIMKIAERTDPNSSWTFVRTISEIQQPGYSDWRPSLTADELTMFWSSYRPAGDGILTAIWTATRSSISEPFANVTHVQELDIHTVNEVPCILPDGLTIYFHTTSFGHPWRFYTAHRQTTLEPFSIIKEVTMLDGSSFDGHTVFVTPDEEDIYFYSQWMGQGEGVHVSYYE